LLLWVSGGNLTKWRRGAVGGSLGTVSDELN